MAHLLLATLLTLVELNCENLFDCEHDSLKQDTEYLPTGARRWTPYKYWTKVRRTASALLACGTRDGRMAELIALSEIENDSVVRDLARRSQLRQMGYEYLTTNSPDVRGIDVALLYDPYSFRPLSHRTIPVRLAEGQRPTRDILYASGLILSGDTLHLLVAHASSRFGGRRSSEPRRMATIHILCQTIDSIRALSPDAKIIIAGDLNDGPGSLPLKTLEEAGMIDAGDGATVRASEKNTPKVRGTYKYEGRWESIDHILVSAQLQANISECFICAPDFLIEKDSKYGGVKPKRSWNGYRFRRDGYSDHLPLVVRFSL